MDGEARIHRPTSRETHNEHVHRKRTRTYLVPTVAALVAAFAEPREAKSFDIETEGGVKIRWDNTVKYSTGLRLGSQSAAFLANPNIDDGNRNFSRHSLISNRVDLLSELDARYGNYGLSVSGAAWYDNVYNRGTDHDSPATSNNLSVPFNEFTAATRNLSGRRAEILNAFALGKFDIAGAPVTIRAGRHTVLWGESLFFPDNGIAYGMAGLDAQKALSVPNTLAKELFLPTSQLSTVVVLPEGVSLEAIYQFSWRSVRLPPAGSYFSPADLLGPGGESILAPVPGGRILRAPDEKPRSKQFGGAVKWRPEGGNVDMGFYALRFDEKAPRIFNALTAAGGLEYVHAYQENIQLYGFSASMSVGSVNLAGELSYRRKQPLALTTNPDLAPLLRPGQNSQDAGPLGDVVFAEGNVIYVGRPGPFYDNISFTGSIAAHHLIRVTENASAFDTTTNRTSYGVRGVVSFDYYQVIPGLDVNVPIGIGWTVKGRSVLPAGFNNGYGNHAGDLSIGIQGTYRQSWKGGITLTQYLGKEEDNAFRDRSFLSATISNSF